MKIHRCALAALSVALWSVDVRACPAADATVGALEMAVLEARFDDIPARVDDVKLALGCGELVAPALLARVWLAQGAWLSLTGAPDEAALAFQSAARVAPGTWNADYGPALEATWRAASAAEAGVAGQVRVEPEPEGMRTAIDGAVTSMPAVAAPGHHLVQVLGPEPNGALHAAFVVVAPGERAIVNTGALSLADASGLGAARERFPTWLVVGGASAALAAGSAAVAWTRDGAMQSASSVEALDSAYALQRGFGWAAYGLAGVSAAGFTLHFVR